MYQAFAVNVMIVAIVIIGVICTSNPLFCLLVLALQPMPFVPPGLYGSQDEEPADDSPKIGFFADIGGDDDEEFDDDD